MKPAGPFVSRYCDAGAANINDRVVVEVGVTGVVHEDARAVNRAPVLLSLDSSDNDIVDRPVRANHCLKLETGEDVALEKRCFDNVSRAGRVEPDSDTVVVPGGVTDKTVVGRHTAQDLDPTGLPSWPVPPRVVTRFARVQQGVATVQSDTEPAVVVRRGSNEDRIGKGDDAVSVVVFNPAVLDPIVGTQMHCSDPDFCRDVFNPESTEDEIALPGRHHALSTDRNLDLARVGVTRNVDAHSLGRVVHPETAAGQRRPGKNLLERTAVEKNDLAPSRKLVDVWPALRIVGLRQRLPGHAPDAASIVAPTLDHIAAADDDISFVTRVGPDHDWLTRRARVVHHK